MNWKVCWVTVLSQRSPWTLLERSWWVIEFPREPRREHLWPWKKIKSRLVEGIHINLFYLTNSFYWRGWAIYCANVYDNPANEGYTPLKKGRGRLKQEFWRKQGSFTHITTSSNDLDARLWCRSQDHWGHPALSKQNMSNEIDYWVSEDGILC